MSREDAKDQSYRSCNNENGAESDKRLHRSTGSKESQSHGSLAWHR